MRNLNVAILVSIALMISQQVIAEDQQSTGLRELTQEELEHYEFDIEESTVLVKGLSPGQQYVLTRQRTEIKDLIARHIGILRLKNGKADVVLLQGLVDKKAIRSVDVRGWQGLGIVFGDILVGEFGLHWVSYEDDLGINKALRWRKTENYVFPVTMFSKRVQFREKIDVAAVYDKMANDIEQFKAYENNRPVFKE